MMHIKSTMTLLASYLEDIFGARISSRMLIFATKLSSLQRGAEIILLCDLNRYQEELLDKKTSVRKINP